ncbi:hypothetical protein ACFSKL_17945 [Belliella marina]|uniref:Uncharacterized protein n=1 Tax=Belliella marina TaxID=1644146 RepID=A0ABW4VPH9_9BACT
MDVKNFIIAVFSGVVGTIAMTIVMYIYSKIVHQNTKVVHVLGTMLTGGQDSQIDDKKIFWAGCVGHTGVGVLFSFAYFLLWNWGIFRINFEDSVWVGILSGLVAIVIWRTYFNLHRSPPAVSLNHYSIALFLAHIVFGIVTVNLFFIIVKNPNLWYELQDSTKLSFIQYKAIPQYAWVKFIFWSIV